MREAKARCATIFDNHHARAECPKFDCRPVTRRAAPASMCACAADSVPIFQPPSVVWEPKALRWLHVPKTGTSFANSIMHAACGTSLPDWAEIRVRPDYLPESRVLVLEGRVELGTVDTVSVAMRDPVRQSAASLARAVDDAGIEVEGGLRVRWTGDVPDQETCTHGNESACPGSQPLFSMYSPPVSTIVAGILEPSQNWMTEQTVRALGARYGDQGSWREGVDVVEAFLVVAVVILLALSSSADQRLVYYR